MRSTRLQATSKMAKRGINSGDRLRTSRSSPLYILYHTTITIDPRKALNGTQLNRNSDPTSEYSRTRALIASEKPEYVDQAAQDRITCHSLLHRAVNLRCAQVNGSNLGDVLFTCSISILWLTRLSRSLLYAHHLRHLAASLRVTL